MQAFRILYYGDIKIDHNGVLVAANEYTLERLIRTGVDFLMRDIGRYINEIARARFADIFQCVAPAHSGFTADNINNAFQCAVMMHACF